MSFKPLNYQEITFSPFPDNFHWQDRCPLTREKYCYPVVAPCNFGFERMALIHQILAAIHWSLQRPTWVSERGEIDIVVLRTEFAIPPEIDVGVPVDHALLTPEGKINREGLHIFERRIAEARIYEEQHVCPLDGCNTDEITRFASSRFLTMEFRYYTTRFAWSHLRTEMGYFLNDHFQDLREIGVDLFNILRMRDRFSSARHLVFQVDTYVQRIGRFFKANLLMAITLKLSFISLRFLRIGTWPRYETYLDFQIQRSMQVGALLFAWGALKQGLSYTNRMWAINLLWSFLELQEGDLRYFHLDFRRIPMVVSFLLGMAIPRFFPDATGARRFL